MSEPSVVFEFARKGFQNFYFCHFMCRNEIIGKQKKKNYELSF